MNWVFAVGVVLMGLVVLCAVCVLPFASLYSEDILGKFRTLNTNLLCDRFGPEGLCFGEKSHRVLDVQESKIIVPRQAVPFGLRQVFLIEDEHGGHWRVVVAHENGRPPEIDAQRLGN